ncbi:sigma-54 dependent transcriptional regulator [soil metagenome]
MKTEDRFVRSPSATDSRPRVLIADDMPANLDLLTQVLEPEGYHVLAVKSGKVCIEVAAKASPDIIILDALMPDMDGYETCRQLRADVKTRSIPVLFVSGREETSSVIEAFNAGAVDYVAKPFEAREVLARVRTHLQLSRLSRQLWQQNVELEQKAAELAESNERLKREIGKRQQAETAREVVGDQLQDLSSREAERWGLGEFVGKSGTITKILQGVKRLQNFGSINALITGESGTGKELVARAIHFGSGRSKGPFIPVNCVAIPSELAESMLFGHVRGAFTGATMDRKGLFELAHGGTLFLDEIGDMPAQMQAKLLRVLEDGRVTPLGATKDRQVDVRIVAATNADLQSQIERGAFRQDLYFRLAQFTVELPPLRERQEDIPLLAAHFVRMFSRDMGMPEQVLPREVLAVLAMHPFPGNVRELKNVIERALIESGGDPVRPEHLHLVKTARREALAPRVDAQPEPAESTADGLPLNLEAAENALIRRALSEANGNIAEAARRLGINRTRIYRRLSDQEVGQSLA